VILNQQPVTSNQQPVTILSGIEHQTIIQASSEAPHHKTMSEFCEHNDLNMCAS